MEDEELLTPRQKRFLEGNPEASLTPQSDVRPGLTGVAGWLGLLVASLLVFGPILTVVMTYAQLSDAESLYPWMLGTSLWEDVQLITWTSVAAFCLVSIYAGLRLLRKHVPSSVGIAIACLWIAGPLLGIATLVAIGEAGVEPTAADVGATMARPLIWALIWTLYLVFSRRVRNTYLHGQRLGAATGESWGSISRRARQIVFFSLCWLVLTVLYFQVMEPYGRYPYEEELRKMWAIILLPPILIGVGTWAYRRIVGTDD